MSRFPTISIPATADKAAADVRPLVEQLRGYAQTAARLDREIRESAAPIEAARRELDVSETALAVAEEMGIDPRKARQDRDAARARLAAAEEVGDHKRRARSGIETQRVTIETEIVALRPPLDQARGEIRGLFREACSKVLRSAMTGRPLLEALRFCAMSRATSGEPYSAVLDDITIRDPMTPGIPVVRLIVDQKYFDEAGALIEDLRVSWRDVPELVAIGNKIEPIVRLAGEVASIATRVRERQDRERQAMPPAPRPKAPPDPTLTMSEGEYRAYRAAEANANRLYPAPGPNPTYSDGSAGKRWA